MNRKEAFLRKGEVPFEFSTSSLYNRAREDRWREDHTEEQMDYLWKHGYIMYTPAMTELDESYDDNFICFTDSGMRWREWYTMSHWEWFKYNVLGYMFWLYKVYYPIRKHVFGKPYPWL